MTGALVLIGTLVLAGAAGLALRARNGRVRAAATGGLPADIRELVDPSASVTLVQLSTTFCAPCRHTRVLLTELASHTDGLRHTELDLTNRPDLARTLAVFRTPTTLAVDKQGTELLRVGGVPNRDTLLEALQEYL